MACSVGCTRELLIQCKEKRKMHRDDIRAQRMCYQRDIARALEDPSFRVVTFDGADQAKTRVPQDWRKNVHGDYETLGTSAKVANCSNASNWHPILCCPPLHIKRYRLDSVFNPRLSLGYSAFCGGGAPSVRWGQRER